MLKLQLRVIDRWVNVNQEAMDRLPEDCDVLAWARRQWPASDWRVAMVRKEER